MRPPLRSTSDSSSPEAGAARLRAGRHRRRRDATRIGWWHASVAGRPPSTVAAAAHVGWHATEAPGDGCDRAGRDRDPLPDRPGVGAIRAGGDRHPRQWACAPVGRPVQLGRRPPARPGRREPRTEPDGVPAWCPGRLWRRVPQRHPRAPVRRHDRGHHRGRTLLGRRPGPARPGWRRPGSLGPGARHPVTSSSPQDRVEAMLAAWRDRCPIYLALLKPQSIALSTSMGGGG